MEKNQIARKMTLVMAEIQSAPQTGTHHHRYTYHTREDAFCVRPALVRHGIATTTRARILSVHGDAKSTVVNIEVEVDFICTDTGQTITASAVGQGQDSGDQAASKAQTNAIKNVFLNTFLLGTEQHDGYAPSVPAFTEEDVKREVEKLETVLIANAGLSPEDALVYIEKHIPMQYAKATIFEVEPRTIAVFVEKLNNALVATPDAVLEKINSSVARLKGEGK